MTIEFQHDSEHEEIDSIPAVLRAASMASRRSFLRRSVVGAALAAPLGALAVTQAVSAHSARIPSDASHSAKASDDAAIPMPSWSDAGDTFHEIQNDEKAHAQFLVDLLHQARVIPRPRPTFKHLWQPDAQSFIALAAQFKNLSVGAYLMVATRLQNRGYLAASNSLLSVEARHAGFLDNLLHRSLNSNGSFDRPMNQATIVSSVVPFIDSLRGGQDPANVLADDGAVLNFALLLEYLEVELYNQNVSSYF